MLVLDLRDPFLALDEVRNQLHRTRSIERNQGDDVVDLSDVEIFAKARHPRRLQLEHAHRFAAVEHRERRRVIERNFIERKLRHALANQRQRVLDHGQRFQTQEIHLQHPQVR